MGMASALYDALPWDEEMNSLKFLFLTGGELSLRGLNVHFLLVIPNSVMFQSTPPTSLWDIHDFVSVYVNYVLNTVSFCFCTSALNLVHLFWSTVEREKLYPLA